MKKYFNKFLSAGIFFVAFFGFFAVTHAQVWNLPTSAPPGGNFATPINTSTSTQFKAGALGVGESSDPYVSTASTGYVLSANGITSTNGLASFAPTFLTDFTHIGPTASVTSPYVDAGYNLLHFRNWNYASVGFTNRVFNNFNNYAAEAPSNKIFASNDNNSIFKKFVTGISDAIASVFSPGSAYAAMSVSDSGIAVDPTLPPSPDPDVTSGPCGGQFCSSTQFCFNGIECVDNAGVTTAQSNNVTFYVGTDGTATTTTITASTTTGGCTSCATDTSGHAGTVVGIHPWVYTPPAVGLTFYIGADSTASTTSYVTSLSSGSANATLVWNIDNAGDCDIASGNIKSNYTNRMSVANTYLNSDGFGGGTHTITYNTPGTYTYILSCTPIGAGTLYGSGGGLVTAGNGAISSSVTVTVLPTSTSPKYVLQVNGNTTAQGFIVADGDIISNGEFLQQGKHVCLQDGTNCPVNSMLNSQEQGGSLELGANNLTTVSSGQKPFVDFHYGSNTVFSDDYNARIQNTGYDQLSFKLNKDPNTFGSTYGSASGSSMFLDLGGLHVKKINADRVYTPIINDAGGGSLELGGNSPSTTQSPFIDFHGQSSTAQDYNFRISNDFNSGLSFYKFDGTRIMYIDSGGNIHLHGQVYPLDF